MPLSRMLNSTFGLAQHHRLSRYGIEDCFTVQTPKSKRLFNAKIRRGGPSDGAGNPVPKDSPTSFFLKSALVDKALN
ncbi:hypothetical protein TNCV_151041 [Trichonephila clavipes]|uniref:Uncharacterized protein n=1 Tax=Trichonephila clavipes TaxID=2585209 RepID=A0A8X6RQF2_TRICX|nr:hypothetical protein TNCV_151041 [Trichonephila clavipes]